MKQQLASFGLCLCLCACGTAPWESSRTPLDSLRQVIRLRADTSLVSAQALTGLLPATLPGMEAYRLDTAFFQTKDAGFVTVSAVWATGQTPVLDIRISDYAADSSALLHLFSQQLADSSNRWYAGDSTRWRVFPYRAETIYAGRYHIAIRARDTIHPLLPLIERKLHWYRLPTKNSGKAGV
ncbi:MAG: hypothetical protein SF053_13410 [Bacteroidia bacterium]|nr:hypothetical protein [Bacteroidia bacterium]